MASINIRDEKDDPIDEIVFADDQYLRDLQNRTHVMIIDDNNGMEIDLRWVDVPYLIKALEKALEVSEIAEVTRRNTPIR